MNAAHEYECIRWSRLITASDLMEEIGDAQDEMLAAVNTGNAELIGAVVLAVHQAYLDRLADRELETELEQPVFADLAARRVLAARDELRNTLAMAEGRHKARRFSGDPLSLFGAI